MEAVCIQDMQVKTIPTQRPQLRLSYLAKVGIDCKQESEMTDWRESDTSIEELDADSDRTDKDCADPQTDCSTADGITMSEEEGLRWHGTRLATYCTAQRVFRCGLCQVKALLDRQMAEHWLGAHAAFKAFQCPRCPYMSSWQRCVRMHLIRHHNDRLAEVVEFDNANTVLTIQQQLARLKRLCEQRAGVLQSNNDSADGTGNGATVHDNNVVSSMTSQEESAAKRHHCPYCAYSTHRRDLYNRHENIHKSDKPFHCYICKKMFNRADHVKKHFLRIHREVAYDVKRIRRIPPKTLTAQVYYARAPTLPAFESSPLDLAKSVNSATESYQLNCDADLDRDSYPECSRISASDNDCEIISGGAASPKSDRHSMTSSTDADSGTASPYHETVIEQIHSEQTCENIKDDMCESLTKSECENPFVFKETIINMKQSSSDTEMCLDESPCQTLAETKDQSERRENRPRRKQECFSCPQCPWKGFDSWCYKRHVNTHIKPYTCSLCPYKAARSERLTFHVSKVHSRRICVKCFFICSDLDTLNEHVANNHGNTQNRQEYTCLTCTSTFRSPDLLERHMVMAHSRKVLHCDQCTFHTTDVDVLQDHIRYSHTEDDVAAVASANHQSLPTPIILKVPSVSPSQHQPSPGADSVELSGELLKSEERDQCSELASPLVSSRASGGLMCRATNCFFTATSSQLLEQHVLVDHADQSVRCPHCAVAFHSPLELCMHWPVHHATLCINCVLLVQQHCAFVSCSSHQLPEARSVGQLECADQLNRSRCGDDSELREDDQLDVNLQQTAEYCDLSDETALCIKGSAMENFTKRSRKQSRPKRLLSGDKENVAL